MRTVCVGGPLDGEEYELPFTLTPELSKRMANAPLGMVVYVPRALPGADGVYRADYQPEESGS